MVLAVHNPTKQNIKIDTSSIPTKMVFCVATVNNSVTALGKSGAEKLLGNGDMLFQSFQDDINKHIQGAFISEEDITKILKKINFSRNIKPPKQMLSLEQLSLLKYGFHINKSDLRNEQLNVNISQISKPVKTKMEIDNKLFAQIVIWSLEHESISCNMICNTFHLGWKRAKEFVDRLQILEIASTIYEKLPRTIIPQCPDDINAEVMIFLAENGISVNDVSAAIRKRESLR